MCVCDRYCVLEAMILKADVMVHGVITTNMYVTDAVSPEAWMLFGLLLELKLWWIHQYLIPYV